MILVRIKNLKLMKQICILPVIAFIYYAFKHVGREKLFLVLLSSQVVYKIFVITYKHWEYFILIISNQVFYIKKLKMFLSDY